MKDGQDLLSGKKRVFTGFSHAWVSLPIFSLSGHMSLLPIVQGTQDKALTSVQTLDPYVQAPFGAEEGGCVICWATYSYLIKPSY